MTAQYQYLGARVGRRSEVFRTAMYFANAVTGNINPGLSAAMMVVLNLSSVSLKYFTII